MKFLVTGGTGFIGSAFIRFLIKETSHSVLNLDKLTYAGNLSSLSSISNSQRYKFIMGDICDRVLVSKFFREFEPDFVVHFAAETHVDRSIDSPLDFVQTNIVGTSVMLECAREYWKQLPSLGANITNHLMSSEKNSTTKESFRFHHISTDEVYGSISGTGLFTEKTAYDPSSPYSASKASSDHLVRAWNHTYGLPILITNSSNNYGPYQFPEKLIPLMILNTLEGKPLPIYGNGRQIRDWLHVEDHARALYDVATKGKVGETYNIGGNNEKTNLEVVHAICDIIDELKQIDKLPHGLISQNDFGGCKNLITFVADRPGHDQRYALDTTKIQKELGWKPQETFETGLRKTVEWYINNLNYYKGLKNGDYYRQRSNLIEQKGEKTTL